MDSIVRNTSRGASRTNWWLGASGLLWAWCYLVHFSGPAGFGGADSGWDLFSESAYLAALLVSLVAAMPFFRWRGNAATVPVARVGTGLMLVSMVLILVGPQVLIPDAVPVAAWAGSVAAGVGTGLVNIAWGVCLASVEAEALERTVLGWYPVFAAVFLLLALSAVSDLPAFVLPALMVVLPVASEVGLECFLRGGKGEVGKGAEGAIATAILGAPPLGNAPDSAERAGFQTLRGYAASLGYLLCAFAASSFVWSAFLAQQAVAFGAAMLLFAVGIGLLALITWIAFARTRHFGLSTLFRWSLPCMALAGTAAALGGSVALSLSCVLLAAVYIGLDSIAKLYFAYAAKRCPGRAAEVFGWGLITGSVGGLLGSWLWSVAGAALQLHGFALVMLVGLVPFALAAAVVIGRDPFLGEGRQSGEAGGVLARVIERGSTAEQPGAEDVLGSPAPESAAADGLSTGAAGATGRPAAAEPATLEARCARLAAQFGLTPRELDVVQLLAQGRSRTYIRETLYISKGTVDTHAYHAYAKCGVKTKDELMALIDEL